MLDILKEHRGFWRQILVMARLDLQRAYKGTLLGSAWAVLKPLITLAMFWFVFSVGIRVGNKVQGVPRFVFMLVGFIPWFYMSDMIKGGAKSGFYNYDIYSYFTSIYQYFAHSYYVYLFMDLRIRAIHL